jgi:UPF0271 protein
LSSGLESASAGKSKRAYVLDASAFMIGGIEFSSDDFYTTESVIKEVKATVIQKSRVEGLVASNALKVSSPQSKYLDLARSRSIELGESTNMSSTDLEIIALALELASGGHDVTIITDDYSVQNIAASFGLKWSGIKYSGITRLIRWKMICDLCKYETYDAGNKTCPRCGSKMRRKPIIKELKS